MQAVAQRNIDPYAHLARFFTGGEVEHIMCFPNNSVAQVDYMVGLKDPLGLCSDDTRRGLYKLFGVANAAAEDSPAKQTTRP